MKKLLLIAILMLALVFTVVACTEEKPGTDTTVGEDTTVETPTEAPTNEPDDTTAEPDETTAEPDETTAEPEETTEEVTTEEVTTEEVTTEEETTEAPTADPADPVWIVNPEELNDLANVPTASNTAGELKDGYVSLTAKGADPWFMIAGNLGDMPQYLAIRYRTNTDKKGEIFTGNGTGPVGGQSFTFDYNTNGEWNLLIFDLKAVASYMETSLIGYMRYDFFVDVPAEGTYLDVAFIGIFNSAEYAVAYDFEQYPPYVEIDDAAAGKKGHSFDTFYVNGSMYFPEDGGAGDKLTAINNTITFGVGEAHESLALRGWIGFNQPIAEFGYFIDNYAMVYGEHKQDTAQDVLNAGGEHASRFMITVPLADLTAGTHMIGFVVKLEDGTIVRLRENITLVIVPENLAQNKPTEATTMQGGVPYDVSAPMATDGDATTRWAAEPTVPSDLIVDLQGLCTLSQITVSFEQAMMNYTISVSEDGENYTVVYEGVAGDFATEPIIVDVELDNISARYVKVSSFGEGGNYFSIWELCAYGTKAPAEPINVALNRPTTATSVQGGSGMVGEFAVDGDASTRWASEPTVPSDFIVDFQGRCSLSRITVSFEQVMMNYTISVSEDGENYTVVYEGVAGGFATEPIIVDIELDNISARYVKVSSFGEGGNYFSIWELTVMGVALEDIPDLPVNVALNKTATATSTQDPHVAQNAIDGDMNTRWGANPQGTCDLIIDLGALYVLNNAEVTFEQCLMNYTISVSENGENYTVVYEGASEGWLNSLKTNTYELNNVTARFVKFTRLPDDGTTDFWFSIVEAKIYGVNAE